MVRITLFSSDGKSYNTAFLKQSETIDGLMEGLNLNKTERDPATSFNSFSFEPTDMCVEMNRESYNFTNNNAIQNSEQIYTQKKIISSSCSKCKLKFNNVNELRVHRAKYHGLKAIHPLGFKKSIPNRVVIKNERVVNFKCRHCDFKCRRYVELHVHGKEVHGVELQYGSLQKLLLSS